jgi:hypothetical protein
MTKVIDVIEIFDAKTLKKIDPDDETDNHGKV